MVFGYFRGDSSAGDKVGGDRCFFLRGVFVQDDEMRLLLWKEEKGLFICLVVKIGN